MGKPFFIAEVSSNHAGDIDRCMDFIRAAAKVGCDAVKFQLFRINQLFAPEILQESEEHRARQEWELPLEFLPELARESRENGLQFTCTPFYIEAVRELEPYVDFYKIASYELLWDELIRACAETRKPLVLSTGMATLDEIGHAVEVFEGAGGTDLTILHCVSGYPVPVDACNLAAIETIRQRFSCDVGWSDHSRNPGVVHRAIDRYGASMVEFHLDLDEKGAEYASGHCWLPDEIAPVIAARRTLETADGSGVKIPTSAEIDDRLWRADPSDGLRPFLEVRRAWAKK